MFIQSEWGGSLIMQWVASEFDLYIAQPIKKPLLI